MDYDVEANVDLTIYNRGPYNVFRRIFRMFEYTWERLMLIVISTNGQISVLLPELEMDPSRRQTSSNKFIENFALVETYNVNSDIALTIEADPDAIEADPTLSAEKKQDRKSRIRSDWNIFLKSNERIVEFFKLGRPLIYATYLQNVKDISNYNLETPFKDCYEFSFLMDKIFGGSTRHDRTSNVAQLYSMFNLSFGTNFLPSHLRAEDLIENYLMTLIRYLDEDGVKHLVACFLPEGAFNFLSVKYFVDNEESLKSVFILSARYGLCNVGQFGELLAQFTLLHNAFYIIDKDMQMVRKLVFESIDLKVFLLALTDNDETTVGRYFELNPELVDSRVSFSYFEHFPDSIFNPYNLMARCLLKASAATLNEYFRGIDLMIPLILKSGTLSFLGIQVKFVKQYLVKTTINEAIDKMTFKNMFGEAIKVRPFGLIILALGDYTFDKGKKMEISLKREEGNSLDAPTILVFKGRPPFLNEGTLQNIFDLAPKYFCYRGVCSEHLKACDHLYGLIQELPLSKEALKALEEYVPKSYEEAKIIDSQITNTSRTTSTAAETTALIVASSPTVSPKQEMTRETSEMVLGSSSTGKRTVDEPSESAPKRSPVQKDKSQEDGKKLK
jgi:hypothetical protein